MPGVVVEAGPYKHLTASGLVYSGKAKLLGIFVWTASASPTIQVLDGITSGGTAIGAAMIPLAGTWYPMPFKLSTGIYIIIANSVDCTIAYDPGF